MENKNGIVVEVKKNDDEKWDLCCSTVYKLEIVFFTQITFILLLSVFSMIQIVNNAPYIELYFSILSTCIGIVIPSPSLQHSFDKK